MAEKSVFQTLNAVNVNDKIEKKNGLSYVSWAYAWGETKKLYPLAFYTVYENNDGWNYFTDGRTCWVKTGVTIEGLEHIEYLPVMDFKNKSIQLENVTSFDVNKTIQRSLTKALARHGLGLYVYAGEDLPDVEPEKISKEQAMALEKVIEDYVAKKGGDLDKIKQDMLIEYKVKSFEEMTEPMYRAILQRINKAMK